MHENFDFLIIMGGPQSACTLEEYPYLFDEVALIKKAIEKKKIVLGFCLGAQLIGKALGADAERSPYKEVGVFPITLTQEGISDSLLKNLPTTFNVIHWHNDMPGLTSYAKILATSLGCPRQIVKYADTVYGFQCHLEITAEEIAALIQACPDDLKPSQYTQTVHELLGQDYDAINKRMIKVLDGLVA